MKRFALLSLSICILFGRAIAQTPVNLTDIKFTVSEADDWSNLLKRDSGWFGGDGIYTIPLNGKESKTAGAKDKVMFIFSDSMVGEIKDNKLLPGYTMTHNAVGILDGNQPLANKMHFYWDKNAKGKPESIFIPKTKQTEKTDYYWLGDGFMNQYNNNVYIFGYRIRQVSTEAFGFREVGNTLIRIRKTDLPPYQKIDQMDTPFYITDGKSDIGSYGTGIYVNTKESGAPKPDGYIYVYGVRGMAKVMTVARVLPKDFETYSKWTFYNGKTWVSDMNAAAPLTDGVSNELSLSPLPDGRYALIFQHGGMSTTVGMRIGASPIGPFGPVIKLWDSKPDLTEKTYVVYNAKAHPSLSKPGELIISYNINSVEFDKDLVKDPNFYRPRFIRVTFAPPAP